MKYRIVQATTVDDMEEQCNAMLMDGATPIGGLVATEVRGTKGFAAQQGMVYSQAFVYQEDTVIDGELLP